MGMWEHEISYKGGEWECQKQVVGLKGKATKRITEVEKFLIHVPFHRDFKYVKKGMRSGAEQFERKKKQMIE